MDARFLLMICALCFASVIVEARRRQSGRRRGSSDSGTRYAWVRELGDGNTVTEEAVVLSDRNQVYVKSNDDSLTRAGFTKVGIFYDFTSTPAVMAITKYRQRGGACYILDITLTYNEAIEILTTNNNTVVSPGVSVSLDGTSQFLSRDASRALLSSKPALRRSCKGGRIIRVSANAATASSNTQVLKFLTLNSVVSLTVQTGHLPIPTRGGGRRGGGRRG